MPKLLLRLVAFSLVIGVLLDPAWAGALFPEKPAASRKAASGVFSTIPFCAEAVVPSEIWVGQASYRDAGVRRWRKNASIASRRLRQVSREFIGDIAQWTAETIFVLSFTLVNWLRIPSLGRRLSGGRGGGLTALALYLGSSAATLVAQPQARPAPRLTPAQRTAMQKRVRELLSAPAVDDAAIRKTLDELRPIAAAQPDLLADAIIAHIQDPGTRTLSKVVIQMADNRAAADIIRIALADYASRPVLWRRLATTTLHDWLPRFPSIAKLLMEAAGHPDLELRSNAMEILGKEEITEAMDVLHIRFYDDDIPRARAPAARALADMGHTAEAFTLFDQAPHSDASNAGYLILSAVANPELIVPLLNRLDGDSRFAGHEGKIIELLSQIVESQLTPSQAETLPREVVDALFGALVKNAKAPSNGTTVRLLNARSPGTASRLCVARLETETDPARRVIALGWLGVLGDGPRTAVEPFLKASENEVRLAAVRALAGMGDFSHALNLFIEDSAGEGYDILSRTTPPAALPALEKLALDDARPRPLRFQAARLAHEIARYLSPAQAADALYLVAEARELFVTHDLLVFGASPAQLRALLKNWENLEMVMKLEFERTVVFVSPATMATFGVDPETKTEPDAYNQRGVYFLRNTLNENGVSNLMSHEPVHSIGLRLDVFDRARLDQALRQAPRDAIDLSIGFSPNVDTDSDQLRGDVLMAWINDPEKLFMIEETAQSRSVPTFIEWAAENIFTYREVRDGKVQRKMRLYLPKFLHQTDSGKPRFIDVPVDNRRLSYPEILALYLEHWPYAKKVSGSTSPADLMAQKILLYLHGRPPNTGFWVFPYIPERWANGTGYTARPELIAGLAELNANRKSARPGAEIGAFESVSKLLTWQQVRLDIRTGWLAFLKETPLKTRLTPEEAFAACLRAIPVAENELNDDYKPLIPGIRFVRQMLKDAGILTASLASPVAEKPTIWAFFQGAGDALRAWWTGARYTYEGLYGTDGQFAVIATVRPSRLRSAQTLLAIRRAA